MHIDDEVDNSVLFHDLDTVHSDEEEEVVEVEDDEEEAEESSETKLGMFFLLSNEHLPKNQ
jgi:hypothetical protein